MSNKDYAFPLWIIIGLLVMVCLMMSSCASTIPQEKIDEFTQACSGNAICIVELEDAFLEKLKDEHEYKLVEYQQLYLTTKEYCDNKTTHGMMLRYSTPCGTKRSCLPRYLTDTFACIDTREFFR